MAEEGNVISNLRADTLGTIANGADTAPAAGIITQYVKDLSVENPNAPESFSWAEAPTLDVQFNIAARAVPGANPGELHEVELKVTLTAKAEAGTAYIVDLAYCALVGMRNLDEASMHGFLFAEAPRLTFPFARRVIADAVRDAGFPAFLLEPIDFNGLYLQQIAQAQAEAQAQAAQGEPAGNA